MTGLLPVEGPLQQELACSFGEAATALVRLQDLSDHIVQPGSPLVQRALLLQSDLKILLQALNHALVTLTHPRRLFLLHMTNMVQQTARVLETETSETTLNTSRQYF